jgi:glucose dehydrogenase
MIVSLPAGGAGFLASPGDARTGKRIWHFQTVHHDPWDYDLATSPKLLTVKHDGRDIDRPLYSRLPRAVSCWSYWPG